MTVGERIKIIRKEAGMNQAEFASELSISTTSVCQLELGRYQIARTTKRILCSRFHVNPEWLETGEGGKYVEMNSADLIPDITKILEENCAIRRLVESACWTLTEGDWKALDGILGKVLPQRE